MDTARIKDIDGYTTLVDVRQLDQAAQIPGLSRTLLSLHPPRKKTDTCPFCGYTLAQALQTGLFGCGICYTALYPAWEEARQKATASSAQVSSQP